MKEITSKLVQLDQDFLARDKQEEEISYGQMGGFE
jgi:hypothetical protein